MSINLYQKHRPYSFEDVIGQEYIKTILLNSIKDNKVQGTYLFNGPRGTGKTSIARIFSRMINCDSKDNPGNDDCDTCKYFLDNKEYDDIFELDAASNNGVEDIRKIIENVKYQPVRLNKKIYIIDEVHMLSKGAFNALLKTLEEPYDNTVFILATTEVNKVPPTILSRCQRFDFTRIDEDVLIEHFKSILDKENIEYEADAFLPIAKLSDGCVRDGLSLLQKVINYDSNKITLTTVISSLGIVSEENYNKIYEYFMDNNTKDLLALWDDIYMSGIDINSFIIDFQVFLKEKYVKDNKNLKLLDAIYKVNDIEGRAIYTQNLKNLVDLLFLQLTSNFEPKVEQTVNYNNVVSTKRVESTKPVDFPVNDKPEPVVADKPARTVKESTPKTYTESGDIDDSLVESALEVLKEATKDKRIEMVKTFESISETLSSEKKFGLAKFFIETQIRAVSNNGLVVSIDSSIKESFISRKSKIYERLENIENIKILDDLEWEIVKQRYVSKPKESFDEPSKEEPTNEEDLELVKKIEGKLNKKIEIIKE